MLNIQVKRNYGIDALRLIVMFFVVILHILGQGGVLDNASGKEYYLCYFFETLSFCAVDCYAIISGYVRYNENEKPLNYGKYGKLWIQVLFYSLVITLVFYFFQPGSVGNTEIVHSFFPVSFNKYWFFTEYTALFFMMPWIDKLIRGMSKRDTNIFAAVIICVFSVYTTFFQYDKNGFRLSGGYSFIWLALLYIIGCWIKKCGIAEKLTMAKKLVLLAVFVFIPFAYSVLSSFLPFKLNLYLVDYISVFTLGTAILLVLVFSQAKISKKPCKLIKFLSPATFGVYLIHEHPCIKNNFIVNRFVFIANASIWKISLWILGYAFVVFVICLLIEKVRLFVFEKLKINDFSIKTMERIQNWIYKKLRRFIEE